MLDSKGYPSSFLFVGPEGSGKELMALYFAARINCGGECWREDQRCASCSKISRLEHPDVHLIYPIPYGSIETSLAIIIESRRKNFFNRGEFGRKSRSIGIDLIRSVIEKASKHPFEGKKTIIIIFEAHLATREAQNAFLKLLEEPPQSVIIILITEFQDRLLPTITSRCYKVRFDYLSTSDVESFFHETLNLKEEEAKERAIFSEGNIRRAVRYGDERFRAIEKGAKRVVCRIIDRKPRDITIEAGILAKEYDREELELLLEEVVRIFRVLMKAEQTNGDMPESIKSELGEKRVALAKLRNFPEDLGKILSSVKNLGGNADVELTLLQLLLDLAGEWY
ncbi:AAA family ATPase [bacterium]|nr:AAA family ATPase [bacterium]